MSEWMQDESDCVNLVADARSAMLRWQDASIDEQAAEALKVRRCLGRLDEKVEQAENNLLMDEMDFKVTEREGMRRRAVLEGFKQDRSQMMARLKEGVPAVRSRQHNFSPAEVRHLQRQGEVEQEELLGDLGDSLVRRSLLPLVSLTHTFFSPGSAAEHRAGDWQRDRRVGASAGTAGRADGADRGGREAGD